MPIKTTPNKAVSNCRPCGQSLIIYDASIDHRGTCEIAIVTITMTNNNSKIAIYKIIKIATMISVNNCPRMRWRQMAEGGSVAAIGAMITRKIATRASLRKSGSSATGLCAGPF